MEPNKNTERESIQRKYKVEYKGWQNDKRRNNQQDMRNMPLPAWRYSGSCSNRRRKDKIFLENYLLNSLYMDYTIIKQ